MKLSIIVAVDDKNGIGKGGKLLFNIPEDMARFKIITTGHSVIMGRKTFEKDIGKCLPHRSNIIITRDDSLAIEGGIIAHSLEEAIKLAKDLPGSEEAFVIGGGQIYDQAIAFADKLYITKVEGTFEVDTVFPDYSMFAKKIFEQKGESNGFKYTFLELEK
jgi:dihydrofolate reductase